MALLVLARSSEIEFELTDMLLSYFLKEHDSKKGRYTLNIKKDREHLIAKLSTSNKAWKNDFLFILDECLENKEGPQILYAWQKEGKDYSIFF